MFKSVFCDIIFAMNRKIDYKINEKDTGKTVEGFLKEHGYTHQVLVRLKQTDHGILRNGIWAYTNERLCKDDLITVQIVENECSDNIAPVNLPLDIAYEDDDIIVINKPFDMPAHPCRRIAEGVDDGQPDVLRRGVLCHTVPQAVFGFRASGVEAQCVLGCLIV